MSGFGIIESTANIRECLAVISRCDLIKQYGDINGKACDYVIYGEHGNDTSSEMQHTNFSSYCAFPFNSQSNMPFLRTTSETKDKLAANMYAVECWEKYSALRTIVKIPFAVGDNYDFRVEANAILDVCEDLTAEMHEAYIPLIIDVIKCLSSLVKLENNSTEVENA